MGYFYRISYGKILMTEVLISVPKSPYLRNVQYLISNFQEFGFDQSVDILIEIKL